MERKENVSTWRNHENKQKRETVSFMEYSIAIKLLVFLKEAVMETVTNKTGKESRGNLGCLVNLLCCNLQAIVSHSVFLQTLDLRGGNVCSLAKRSSMVK